ncbi:MAG: F0F1 ATP synthase subunit delta, partial [Bacteroidales bacterium]|nr:F0F1 ATP synthase subunit delta [Bacteroidales bacterium]
MSEGVIPGRYAMALYKYVYDKGLSSKLYTIAKEVERAYTATPELRKTLINPVVSAADKISIMNTIV